jgi:hypothetical protein
MKLALTDLGRKYMEKAWDTDFESDDPPAMEDAATMLFLFEIFGPVIEAEQVYKYAYQETNKKDSWMVWSVENLTREHINRIVKHLFEARYLEEVQEYDEDDILMTMNPTAIPLEEAKEMHQKAKWERMRREYQVDKDNG